MTARFAYLSAYRATFLEITFTDIYYHYERIQTLSSYSYHKKRSFYMPVISAVAYARYSSDKQQESSIVVQLAAIKQFCQRHNVQIVREYIDEAQTGTSANRINFQKMVSDVQLKDFQYIIVHRMDRWARNVDDARYYKKYFKKYGIKIISAIEEFDDSPEGEFFELISLGIAEMYSKKLAREAKAGVMANAREGKAHSGTPPIGYAKKDKRYVLVEEEAKAVKIMFEMAADGYGYTSIANYLNSNGYRRANGKLYSNHLHDILRNREYTGEYIFNKGAYRARNEPYNSHKERPSSEIIRIHHGMPQIISYDLFNKVQSMLDARKIQSDGLRSPKRTALLSGLCICGICEGTITASWSGTEKKRIPIYICNHKKSGCNGKAINAEYLEDYILSLLSDCLLLPRNYDCLCELIKTCYINASDELDKKSDELLSRIREIESKIEEYRKSQTEGDKCINNIIEGNIRQLEVEKGDRLYEKENIDGNIAMFPPYNVKTISRLSKIIRDLLESQEVKERRNGIIKMIYKINIDNDYVKSIVNFQELLNSPFPILLTVIERRDFIARAENHYRRSLTFHSLNVAVGK